MKWHKGPPEQFFVVVIVVVRDAEKGGERSPRDEVSVVDDEA